MGAEWTGTEWIGVITALFLWAVACSEINRPRSGPEYDYGAKEWGCITGLTLWVMVIVFVICVLLVQ